jgi:hypothetical protein
MEVAYTPTSEYNQVLNTPPSKTPLISGIILFGRLKILSGTIPDSVNSTVIYSIPEGVDFFITSCFMSGKNKNPGTSNCALELNNGDILITTRTGSLTLQDQATITHNLPLRIYDDNIIMSNDSDRGDAIYILTAYEVPRITVLNNFS